MALSLEGATAKVEPQDVIIAVSALHPLVKLANLIPWPELIALCLEDLKRTTAKGCWWTGRKLYVRIHLAVYILQKLFNKTDRQIEKDVKDNAAYQLFCGATLIAKWHCPDHTKIEEFRSRLSPETQRQIANGICKCAVSLGFADPSEADIDSTVQEANIAYPSDASLMTKLAAMGKKVIDYLSKKTRGVLPEGLVVDMKAVKGKAREYFFMPKNADIEKRRSVFKGLLQLVKQQMRPVVEACADLDSKRLARMPWNIRRAVEQINSQAWRYLLDVAHFTRTHTIKAGKVLSFHAAAVACIKKGKAGKDKEFGRIFQLGRIKGNFFFVGAASASLKTNDKQEFVSMLDEHAGLFGEGTLKSVSTDKGYWSAKNHKELAKRGVEEIGLQRPANLKKASGVPSKEIQDKLRDRRAGIEPLIGHTKHGGQLRRSRMKSDAATLAAAYGSVLGFNLRQMIRHQEGKMKKAS